MLRLSAFALPAVVFGCGAAFDPDAVPESIQRFPRTPIAGDTTDTRAVIVFFVADDAAVTLRVWAGDALVVDEAVPPSGDGFHKVFVDDLTPGTTYRYAVFSGEAPRFEDRSLIGQLRTAPAADARVPVRLALLSCVGQGTILPDYYLPESSDDPTEAPFRWEVFTHAAGLDLDGLVHLGDQAYLDFVWSREEGTLEAYLHAWGFYHGGGYRDIYPLASLYATWDDHESTDNSDFDPWDLSDDDAARLANAEAAWFKVVPIDATVPGPVWRSFRWGATVELLLLDCRTEITPDRLMSEAQLAWVIARIATSPCRFVCVATPKPFAEITSSVPLFEDSADRWESFPADRERLAAAIDALEGPKVLFVCGDVHMNYLGRARITGDRLSERAWEVCCTSGNVNPLAGSLSDEQFVYVDAAPNLPVLTFDPVAGTVRVVFYAADGSVGFEEVLDG